ncbi:unnamed protein product [Leuciscus chuanchicus]
MCLGKLCKTHIPPSVQAVLRPVCMMKFASQRRCHMWKSAASPLPLPRLPTTVPLEVTGLVKKGQIIIREKVPGKRKFLHEGMTRQLIKSQKVQIDSMNFAHITGLQEENLNAFIHLLDSSYTPDAEIYGSLLKEAKDSVENEKLREGVLSRPVTVKEEVPPEDDYIPTYDALLQMELERLLVKENAVAVQKQHQVTDLRATGSPNNWLKKLCKLILPEYTLDFGYVINGSIVTHIVKITNTCPVAVSFRADKNSLAGTGFSTELDRVKNLPFCETETFEVKFDTREANLGKINAVMPIQVTKGPQVQVCICAEVTMPSLTVSTDTLQFDTIQCGLCQVITVQLYNDGPVPCEWSIRQEERPKKIDKHIPLYLRRQALLKQRPPPVVFELLPSDGTLYPGDRTNMQVKFSPAEGRTYSQRLVITVAQSTQKILLLAQGQGEEPQLEFSSSELDMASILP